ncbi:hypothetical protein [Mycobacterium sp. 48b]|uniref:hypothetical protein n=1 Tax=Mycobacterium sp. 48b TaxID=3400426 RepID=UPI003AB00689
MQNITIGRYKPTPGGPFSDLPVPVKDDEGTVVSTTDVSAHFDGWIEGVRDDGSTWIMWLDASGNPTVFYPNRDADGGVIGDPVDLST